MYRSALILGLGSSGESAARLLLREGTRVTVIDRASGPELDERAEGLGREGASVLAGCDRVPDGSYDVCIASPGVPPSSPWVGELERRGVDILSELELGATRCRCPILAVTGSNGKSTMVKLCTEMLRHAGRRAEMAGNYGVPICRVAPGSGGLDWLVVEVSSFQLERVREFHPRVGVVMNIQPNHLDRHGDVGLYTDLKARLFARMGRDEVGLVHDEAAPEIVRRSAGSNRWLTFGASEAADYRYANGIVTVGGTRGRRQFSFERTSFANPVMGLTAAAAVAAAEACGIGGEHAGAAARAFEPLPHRMQPVGTIRGVRCVDDSKATTLAALRAAVEMTDGKVRLIAGGLLKESDLDSVKEFLAKRVMGVYLIGSAAEKMRKAWGDVVTCRMCGRLEAAVDAALGEAAAGETLLLAPGCTSFDQFKNFEERGDEFRRIVEARGEES